MSHTVGPGCVPIMGGTTYLGSTGPHLSRRTAKRVLGSVNAVIHKARRTGHPPERRVVRSLPGDCSRRPTIRRTRWLRSAGGSYRRVTTWLVAGSALDYPCGSVDRLGGVIMIVVFVELGLVALWIAVGSGRERRSHFWFRVVLASLALPALIAALVGVARVHPLSLSDDAAKTLLSYFCFLGVIVLMFVPGLLYRRLDPSPGSSESDGGGGPGPGQPRPSRDAPRGGVPLPDADQARARARDHDRPKLDELKRRRPAHEPRRTPAATNGQHQTGGPHAWRRCCGTRVGPASSGSACGAARAARR